MGGGVAFAGAATAAESGPAASSLGSASDGADATAAAGPGEGAGVPPPHEEKTAASKYDDAR
jgi:hypothetical protein